MTSAVLPPLEGIDPAWSRTVSFVDADGRALTAHALDSWHGREGEPELTLLCVHGNPTWSYLWRRLLAQAPDTWRVVAVDQVGMGFTPLPDGGHAGTHLADFSPPHPRRLARRVDDLGRIADALGIRGPVVSVGHDWGGPVSLGWALAHRDQLVGVVLANTAVAQPPGSRAPGLIRAARLPGVLETATVRTPSFLRGALRLGPERLDPAVRAGFLAPYRTPESRRAIGDFVADIPLDPTHPSFAALGQIAEGVRTLDVPVLLLWGPADPVFGDLYLRDLLDRMPHADVHRYEGAAHLVTEDAPRSIGDLVGWVAGLGAMSAQAAPAAEAGASRRDLLTALRDRRADPAVAVAELGADTRRVTWAELAEMVDALAAGLMAAGVRPGERVALLVPPGADLTASIYACWRIGAVVVAVDAGLGPRGMARALRGAGPRHVIAVSRGLAFVRALRLRIPGVRVLVGPRTGAARTLGATHLMADLLPLGAGVNLPDCPEPAAADEALVVFTSGATGPAKGVVYRHGALEAQRDALIELFAISRDDALVAAFAPWAVLGPALGIASAVPDMDVTSPGTLTAAALADAATSVGATLAWASPAALRSALATVEHLSPLQRRALDQLRLLMSAGAPVPVPLLEQAQALAPHAELHTPYGMTEVLPVADISLDGLRQAGEGRGVCVGQPVPGVRVRISPSGEIEVRAAHGKDRYDRLWATEQAATTVDGWHRTGDVGHLDPQGRLWVEGRLLHVITTPEGPVTPVPVELAVERLAEVGRAAAVGVGPQGVQQLVVVVVPSVPAGGLLAPLDLLDRVRAAVDHPVAAVLLRPDLPVDRRHNSKVDRAELAAWAAQILAGRR